MPSGRAKNTLARAWGGLVRPPDGQWMFSLGLFSPSVLPGDETFAVAALTQPV